jgi:hypothetical protein
MLGPLSEFVLYYVDDLIVGSDTFEKHIEQLDMLFTRLKQFNMTIHLSKSLFCRVELPFLGHILTTKGLLECPKKVETITLFPRPKTKKQLKGFLGLTSYLRKYVSHLSSLEEPLLKLLPGKNKNINWNDDASYSFNTIKKLMLETDMLYHPDYTRPFYLEADSSTVALGAYLYQKDDQNNNLLISFASRTLSSTERRYTTTELELLAIVYSFIKFRYILLGAHTIVRTDHKALTFIKKCRLLNGRLARWVILLQEFCFDIEYIQGRDNFIADYLSRLPSNYTNKFIEKYSENNEIIVAKLQFILNKNLIPELKQLADLQDEDEKLKSIKINIIDGTKSLLNERDKNIAVQHKVHNNILFRHNKTNNNWNACIPDSLIESLVINHHEYYGHLGVQKIYNIIKEHFYWSNMLRSIAKIISKCHVCQKNKVLTIKYVGDMQPIIPKEPLEIVAFDLYGELPQSRGGVKYILVLIDIFSKYVTLYAIKKCTSRSILQKILNEYIPNVGRPKYILSDNGSQFRSNVWSKTLKEEGIKSLFTSVYNPSANPAERVMRELGRVFRVYCHEKHTMWAYVIPKIMIWFNVTTHSSTCITPYELHFGRKPTREIAQLINFLCLKMCRKLQKNLLFLPKKN